MNFKPGDLLECPCGKIYELIEIRVNGFSFLVGRTLMPECLCLAKTMVKIGEL